MWNNEITKTEKEIIEGYVALLNEIRKDIEIGEKVTPDKQKIVDKYVDLFGKHNITIDDIKKLNEVLVKKGLA